MTMPIATFFRPRRGKEEQTLVADQELPRALACSGGSGRSRYLCAQGREHAHGEAIVSHGRSARCPSLARASYMASRPSRARSHEGDAQHLEVAAPSRARSHACARPAARERSLVTPEFSKNRVDAAHKLVLREVFRATGQEAILGTKL